MFKYLLPSPINKMIFRTSNNIIKLFFSIFIKGFFIFYSGKKQILILGLIIIQLFLLNFYLSNLENVEKLPRKKKNIKGIPLKILIPCYLSSLKEVEQIQIEKCHEYLESIKFLFEGTPCAVYAFYSGEYIGEVSSFKTKSLSENIFRIDSERKIIPENNAFNVSNLKQKTKAEYLLEILNLIVKNESYGYMPESRFLNTDPLKLNKSYLIFVDYNFQHFSEFFYEEINKIVTSYQKMDYNNDRLFTYFIHLTHKCFSQYNYGIFCTIHNTWRIPQLIEFIKIMIDNLNFEKIFDKFQISIMSGKSVTHINDPYFYLNKYKFAVNYRKSAGKMIYYQFKSLFKKVVYFRKYKSKQSMYISFLNGIIFKNSNSAIDTVYVLFYDNEFIKYIYIRWGTNFEISNNLNFSYILDIDGFKTKSSTRELFLNPNTKVKKLMVYPFTNSIEMLLAELIFVYN